MKSRWAVLCSVLAGAVGVAPAGPTQGGVATTPVVSAAVSRTAIHVGDVFEYRITVRHSSDVSFVTQDLERTLVVRPFELQGIRTEQRTQGGQSALNVVLKLACYEKPGRLEIPSFSLFYYPSTASGLPGKGPAAPKDIPARELIVPSQPLNLQSTLLGPEDRLRDSVTLLAFSRKDLALPMAAGIMLFAILVWLAFAAGRYLVKLSQPKAVINEEQLRREVMDRLRGLQRRAAPDGKEPALFLEISKALRQYVGSRYDISCQALTPDEAGAALQKGAAGRDFAEKIRSLLERCDEGFFNRTTAAVPDPTVLCEQAVSLLKSGPRDAK